MPGDGGYRHPEKQQDRGGVEGEVDITFKLTDGAQQLAGVCPPLQLGAVKIQVFVPGRHCVALGGSLFGVGNAETCCRQLVGKQFLVGLQ